MIKFNKFSTNKLNYISKQSRKSFNQDNRGSDN